jgi:hypothetical protein
MYPGDPPTDITEEAGIGAQHPSFSAPAKGRTNNGAKDNLMIFSKFKKKDGLK